MGTRVGVCRSQRLLVAASSYILLESIIQCSRKNYSFDERCGVVLCEAGSSLTNNKKRDAKSSFAVSPEPQQQQKPSILKRWLASINLASLPIPRILLRHDPAFQDGDLVRGLRQRRRDEQTLQRIQKEIQLLQQQQLTQDRTKMNEIFTKVTEVAYGKGVTPQMREDFVARYGCTGWTEDVLNILCELGKGRGFVEIGAGHGQWARALTNHHASDDSDNMMMNRKVFEFVMAYDDMTDLPLSPQVYHKHTQPAHDYFGKVRPCDSVRHVLSQWSSRGRILLLVYPPPGSMALKTIQTYVSIGPENDTVVYVGEGRGGSTANDELFDYLEHEEWTLVQVLSVKSQPGGKGFEKLFILQRPASK